MLTHVLVGALSLSGCSYTAMPNLRGTVIDSATRQPIVGARVDVYGRDGVEEHVVTDASGAFALKGAVHYGGLPIRLVPVLRFQVSASCYQAFYNDSYYPGFNSADPPTLLPIELDPGCSSPMAKQGKSFALSNRIDVQMIEIPGKKYEIGKYEVTRGQFAEFVNATGYDAGNSCYFAGHVFDRRNGTNWKNPGFPQDDNHPVTCVSWDDANAYLAWLSKRTGKQYRLPTEAEWEYACYGGNQTRYCGGNNINAVAWYDDNKHGTTTHPVGQKRGNGYGVYDMSGNVWEWVQAEYANHGVRALRVLRGGSWSDDPEDVRAARIVLGAGHRQNNIGFRLARTLP